jgi:dolichol-phosphate mannosyltransferase
VGWTSTIVIITFFSGIIISTLGLMAEYIRRIYEEVKHRPLYVVRKRVGI